MHLSWETLGDTLSKAVVFTPQYQKKNRGRWSVAIPEVQELLHVVVALTATGQKNANFLNHTTAYYREVMSAFGRYGDENIVQQVDLLLREGEYATLKMNSTAFAFRGNAIVKTGPYN